MRRLACLIVLAFAACSSDDQSLGETRPSPRPIIDIDPTPKPNPNPGPDPNPSPGPDPDPNPNPNPGPDPDPNPDPSPTHPPCEDFSKHDRTGECVLRSACLGDVITTAGYECEGDAVCCDEGVGCGKDCCGPDCSMSQGGQGNDGVAGGGGQP